MLRHLTRHDSFLKNITEGNVEGKSGRETSRRSYIKQMKEKVGIESYQQLKVRAFVTDG